MTSSATSEAQDRGRHLVRGGLLVAAASVAARGASFLAQLVLGRLLLPEDFGLFAIALTFTTLAAAANSVVRSFLVDAMKRDLDLDAVYRLVVWVTLGVTVLFAAATPLLAMPFDEPGLATILLALNLTMPLQVLPALGMARLTNELRFGDLSKLWMVSGVARQVATVAAALAGIGAMSFVMGVVVGSWLEWLMARRATGPSPSWLGKLDLRAVHLDAHGLRVLPISIIVLALWINGDYASAGLFETAAVVGVIMNLGVSFGRHALWSAPDGRFDWFVAVTAVGAFVAMQKFKVGLIPIIGVCAALGWLHSLVAS